MAEIKVPYDEFTLTSTWNCRTVYYYNSTGQFNSSTNTPSYATVSKETVRFPVSLPPGAKVKSTKVHSSHTSGLYGGSFVIGEAQPDDDGFVTLESPDFSPGYIDVVFSWTAWKDDSSAHGSSYPTYNGSSSQSKTYSHRSTTTVSDIYLLIEYEQSGIIYHAESGVLVPYKLYRAEDGALVPYLIKRAENGSLVPFG